MIELILSFLWIVFLFHVGMAVLGFCLLALVAVGTAVGVLVSAVADRIRGKSAETVEAAQ